METGIKLFFARFSMWIIGGLMIATFTGFGGWYVSNLKLQNEVISHANTTAALKASNASYGSIRNEFVTLTNQLKANQEKALESHALLQENVKKIIEADKSRQSFEQALLSRAPVTDCKTPKEVLDAWKRL